MRVFWKPNNRTRLPRYFFSSEHNSEACSASSFLGLRQVLNSGYESMQLPLSIHFHGPQWIQSSSEYIVRIVSGDRAASRAYLHPPTLPSSHLARPSFIFQAPFLPSLYRLTKSVNSLSPTLPSANPPSFPPSKKLSSKASQRLSVSVID